MPAAARHEGHEGFLGDLFLNLAAVVIFTIAVVAVERPPAPSDSSAPDLPAGIVFEVCGDEASMENGPKIRVGALLDSDFGREAVASSQAAPVLRVGPGSDTALFILSAHLARMGRTELVFMDGGCRTSEGARP
jgi:hypothetical protein